MYVTEETSLVEFYRSGLELARESGFTMVFCLIAREADAAASFKEVADKWASLDDLTGSSILFLFAGKSAREQNRSANIYRNASGGNDRLLFNENVLLLPSARTENQPYSNRRRYDAMGHFDLQVLRENTPDRHPMMRRDRAPLERLARYEPSRPVDIPIAENQTREISELRDYLSLRESDIPCLHITFLTDRSTYRFSINATASLYALIKNIIEACGFSEAGPLKAEIGDIANQRRALRQKAADVRAGKPENPVSQPAYALRETTALLQQACTPGAKEEASTVQTLVSHLQEHVKLSTPATRREAFASFNRARSMLERQDQWKSIKSSIQKLIDLASHAGPSPEIDEAEFVRIVERQTANAEALQLQLRKIEAEDASLAARLGECTARLEFVKRPSEIKRRLSSVPNHASLENSQSVYIAHAGEDKSKLLHLLTQLIRHNFTLWIDNPEALSSEWYRANRARIIRIEPGANWRIAIMDALRRADRVLAIWSEHSIEPGRDVFMFEVDQGRVLRKCVQIKIDNTSIDKIPPPFNHDQIFDLSNISDLDAHPGLDDVVRELKVGHVRSG